MKRSSLIVEAVIGCLFLSAAWVVFFRFGKVPHPIPVTLAAFAVTVIHMALLCRGGSRAAPTNGRTHGCAPTSQHVAFWLLLILTILPVHDAAARYSLTLTLGFNGVMALGIALSGNQQDKGIKPLVFIIDKAIWAWGLIERMPGRSFTLGIFFVATAIYATGTFEVFGGIPHVQDGIAQLFQAQIFASGRLTAPTPMLREFFEFPNMIIRNRWYSQYPPGYAAILAIGVIIRAPWLINAMIGALTVVVTYRIGARTGGERVGRISALLLLVSPFYYFLAASYMNHTATALFMAIFVLYYLKVHDRQECLSYRGIDNVDGLIAGLALGYAALIRPLTAAAMCLPFIVYSIINIAKDRNAVFRQIMIAVGAMAGIVALCAYNRATNGSPFLFGYTVLHGEPHNLGFGMRALKEFVPEMFTPVIGLTNMFHDVAALSKHLYEWPFPCLIFAIAAAVFVGSDKPKLRLLAISAACLAVAHVFFFFHRMILGPRFLLEAAPLLCVLTAEGIMAAPRLIEGSLLKGERAAKNFVGVALIIGLLWAMIVNMPALTRAYSRGFWNVTPALDKLAHSQLSEGSKALVFIEGDENYGSGFAFNTPWLDGRIIYARDLGERNGLLISQYPDRIPFIARLDLHKGIVGLRQMNR